MTEAESALVNELIDELHWATPERRQEIERQLVAMGVTIGRINMALPDDAMG